MPIHPDRILFEDDSLLAVAKLPQELVVKGKGKTDKLPLFDFLRKEHPGIHPLQRLDFETSGVIIFAKNRSVLAKVMDTKFDQWKKTYRAVVKGEMHRKEGDIRFELPARTEGKVAAHTHYRVLDVLPGASYVEAEIQTGRHHQIRRHFAMIGHPLALDSVYGDEKFNRKFGRFSKFRRFFLHACSVTFPHPVTGKMVTIECPLPRQFEEVLKKLRGE